jgi:diguanylate cyclase (GGDEF)-like protein
MALSATPEIQKIIEIIIQRRLKQHLADLEQRRETIRKGTAAPAAREGVIDRGFLVHSWSESLQGHCSRTLSDLRALLNIFEDPPSVEWVRDAFRKHVDQVSSELVERLKRDNRTFPSRSSERNTLINKACLIKVEADRVLDGHARQADQKQRNAGKSAAMSLPDLDDRLPLGRRGCFDRNLVEMINETKHSGEPLSLVLIDIDHFKGVNDTHGHQAGDEVLLGVAELIIRRLGLKGKAYRYGGEEFALLLPNYSRQEAAGLAERIRLDIQEAVFGGKKLTVTASFGIASFPAEASEASMLVQNSDQALYKAKRSGRNCVHCWE